MACLFHYELAYTPKQVCWIVRVEVRNRTIQLDSIYWGFFIWLAVRISGRCKQSALLNTFQFTPPSTKLNSDEILFHSDIPDTFFLDIVLAECKQRKLQFESRGLQRHPSNGYPIESDSSFMLCIKKSLGSSGRHLVKFFLFVLAWWDSLYCNHGQSAPCFAFRGSFNRVRCLEFLFNL